MSGTIAPPTELTQLHLDSETLDKAARLTPKGKFYTLIDAEDLFERLPPRSDGDSASVPAGKPWYVWTEWLVLLAVVMFLTAEWLLRKQLHLV